MASLKYKDKQGNFQTVYPSAIVPNDPNHRLVTDEEKEQWNEKQDQLVSGQNIKTINRQNIVGSGNIEIQGGDHTQLTNRDAENQHPIGAIEGLEEELAGKQPTISDLATIREGAAAGSSAYQKPADGIPKTDLATSVQDSLGLADTALQSFTETDPTVPNWAKQQNKPAYTAAEITDGQTNVAAEISALSQQKVDSVNGQTGVVVLNANDIGAASVSALAHANNALDLLFKLTRGVAWDIVQDNAAAYQKTIPSGTHLSILNGWGGKSIVWNQLLKVVSTIDENYGLTITTNPEQQSISISGTSTYVGGTDSNFYTSVFQNFNVIEGHKYFISSTGSIFQAYTYINLPGQPEQKSYIATATGSGLLSYSIKPSDPSNVLAGSVIDETFRCMIIDLTQMFGAGNEPPTVEAFRALFPADYYPYNAGEMMHGDVTGIVLKSAQQTTVKTLTVPAAVRALAGYGWSAGAVANTVEYDATTKKWYYHQRVNRVRLADLSCTTWGSTGHSFLLRSNTSLADLKRSTGYNDLSNVIALEYTAYTHTEVLLGVGSIIQGICSAYDVTGIGIYDNRYSTVENFVQSLGEKFCYYEIDEEIVTDVTALLSWFDNYLNEIEPGGAITFENNYGADYGIPVPSLIDHYRNLSEAAP